jgi:hypothetical protein
MEVRLCFERNVQSKIDLLLLLVTADLPHVVPCGHLQVVVWSSLHSMHNFARQVPMDGTDPRG